MVQVLKLDGTKEEFREDKLKRSLARSGACKATQDEVVALVRKILKPGITTKEIFKFAFKEMKRLEPLNACKFDLKNAILRLGKSGFPFEKYICLIFEASGYECLNNQYIKGKIIPHEIDVDARKGKERIMIECKHHAQPWFGTSIQTALYVYARFLDLSDIFTTPVLVTNTKFSPQVKKYAKGVGMKLMGWKYPRGDSLEENIEKHKLYPITMLSTVDKKVLSKCLHSGILLVKDLAIMDLNRLRQEFSISRAKAEKILKESKKLSNV